jgi:hypothetical protein
MIKQSLPKFVLGDEDDYGWELIQADNKHILWGLLSCSREKAEEIVERLNKQ